MVRVLTGAQVQEERAHENYIHHLDLKPSSYKFYFKSNPTPAQQRKGGPWGVVRFSAPVWNGRCSFNNQHGVRCGRRTVFGIGYCWQHLEDKRHLRIGPLLNFVKYTCQSLESSARLFPLRNALCSLPLLYVFCFPFFHVPISSSFHLSLFVLPALGWFTWVQVIIKVLSVEFSDEVWKLVLEFLNDIFCYLVRSHTW